MGFVCSHRLRFSHRPQTFRSTAQASRLASALGGCPQVISGLVASSTADFHSEDPEGVELGADVDVLMRIGWKGLRCISQSVCPNNSNVSSRAQVSPPLPIPRQMSSSVIVGLRRLLPASRPRRAAIRPSPLDDQWYSNLSSPAAFRIMFLVIVDLRLGLSASLPRRAVFRPSLLDDQRCSKLSSLALHR